MQHDSVSRAQLIQGYEALRDLVLQGHGGRGRGVVQQQGLWAWMKLSSAVQPASPAVATAPRPPPPMRPALLAVWTDVVVGHLEARSSA